MLETGEIQRVGSSKVRKVDVRVLSATNANLGEAVSRGEFREDLLYRLNTVEIRLPPLRERREDIPLLAQHFLAAGRPRATAGSWKGSPRPRMDALIRHPWPGNVRELQHAVERSVLMARGSRIEAADLGLRRREDGSVLMEELTLDEAERLLIEKALERSQGNVSKAAEALGLSRSALYRRLQRHDLGGVTLGRLVEELSHDRRVVAAGRRSRGLAGHRRLARLRLARAAVGPGPVDGDDRAPGRVDGPDGWQFASTSSGPWARSPTCSRRCGRGTTRSARVSRMPPTPSPWPTWR